MVIVTGDLSFSGTYQELKLAQSLVLDPLCSSLSLPNEKVIIVPGNHDIDRTLINSVFETGLKATITGRESVDMILSDPNNVTDASRRLTAWRKFHSEFYEGLDIQQIVGLGCVHILDIDGLSVGIAAVNSAWRASGGQEDRRNILIGERQLIGGLDAIQNCSVQLVAMHHPLEWLHSFDEDAARIEFEMRGVYVFTGHEHQPDPIYELSQRGQAIYEQAGCLYETDQYPNSFSVIDLDFVSRRIAITIRTWWPERRVFDQATNVTKGGVLNFPMPQKNGSPVLQVPYSEVLGLLSEIAQRTSVVADLLPDIENTSLDDFLVEPRFWPVPYMEAVATSKFEDVEKQKPINPIADLADHKVILVSGDSESGVTSALLWLLSQHFREIGSSLPFYLPFDKKFDRSRFEKSLAQNARLVGLLHGNSGDVPPLLIAIDDVDSTAPKALERMAIYIRDEVRAKSYLLGCHMADHERVYERFRSQGVEVKRIFIGPFGRRDLRELAHKLTRSSDSEMVDRIDSLLRTESLPRSPFIMAVLIAVLAHTGDANELNESSLLQSYANLLLEREIMETAEGSNINLRMREHILETLASRFTNDGITRMHRSTMERCLGDYFVSKGVSPSVSPGRVLDGLILRRIMFEDKDGVGFRHPALQNLFSAKYMLENTEFSTRIMEDCLNHIDVVRHAAGLKRSDPKLLNSVAKRVNEVVVSLSEDVSVSIFDLILPIDGWSDVADINQLRSQLAVSSSEPTTDAIDIFLDELYEKGDNRDSPFRGKFLELFKAILLLSKVLQNSELIDDVDLKVEKLKETIHGWGLITVVQAVREDQTHETRELLSSLFHLSETDPEPNGVVEQLVGVLHIFGTLWAFASAIGTIHLEVILNRILDDEEFMGSAVHATLATMLLCWFKFPGWPKHLKQLYEQFHRHPVVAQLVRAWSIATYKTNPLHNQDAKQLEGLIADIYSSPPQNWGSQIGGTSSSVRSDILQELRKQRAPTGLKSSVDLIADPLYEEAHGEEGTDAIALIY